MSANVPKILIVDDEEEMLYSFRRLFEREGYEIVTATRGDAAVKLVQKEGPDLVLMDVRMPGQDGLATLKAMRQHDPKLLVIIMTAYGTTQTTIEAMKWGAYDYVNKPFEPERIKALVREALDVHRAMKSVVSYQPLLSREEYSEGIIGKSEAMQGVYKLIGQVSRSTAPVLIRGESGTGKELVARAIYHHGPRAAQPFLAMNCAAIPDSLLESELFGYEKGAFTGAEARKRGKLERCSGGTLFLDEIGDMSVATQTKLLRVLQEGEFERLGGNETIKVDVRLIAATNKDLEKRIREKKFRSDLYYRLKVVEIKMPALRERADDIPPLTEYFIQKYSRETQGRVPGISREAMERLTKYSWPGNVRELENVLRNSLVRLKGPTLLPSDLMLGDAAGAGGRAAEGASFEALMEQVFQAVIEQVEANPQLNLFDLVERQLLQKALQHTEGNQAKAARLLGITRSTLRKRIEAYGLKIQTSVTK